MLSKQFIIMLPRQLAKVATISLLVLFGSYRCFAQDPTFSQYNLNQYYYNPAYTGDHHGYQIAGTYRTLWPNTPGKVFPGALSTYYALFDAYVKRGGYAAGVGAFGMQNAEGEGYLTTSTFGISYAQHLPRIGGRNESLPRIELSLGFKAYVNTISVNWDKLVFSDQLDLDKGIVGQSSSGHAGIGHKFTADLDVGLLLKNNFMGKEKWYNEVGFGMSHILTPNISLVGEVAKLPRKYDVSYRTSVYLNPHFYIGTTILYENQSTFHELNTGLDLYVNPNIHSPVIPLWFSVMNRLSIVPGSANTNSIIGSLKYKWLMGRQVKTVYFVGFSADFPYSGLGTIKSKGAYELSLGVIIARKGNDHFSRCPFSTF